MKSHNHYLAIVFCLCLSSLVSTALFCEGRPRKPKEPLVSSVLSVVPGGGHFYAEEPAPGFFFLGSAVLSTAAYTTLMLTLPAINPIGLVVWGVLYGGLFIWSSIDSYLTTVSYNRRHGFFTPETE